MEIQVLSENPPGISFRNPSDVSAGDLTRLSFSNPPRVSSSIFFLGMLQKILLEVLQKFLEKPFHQFPESQKKTKMKF